jgi:predicted DCC family thiol-disulfide oxidoreductase YuxK
MNTESSTPSTKPSQDGVWFVYDGDCPICRMAAQAFQIKKAVGHLHRVNARDDHTHPLLQEVREQGFNLDDGMVLKYQARSYHGQDALHMMALLGSGQGWFNRTNAFLFRSKTIARVCYPAMRAVRNTLLRLKGVSKIENLALNPHEPLFKTVFGSQWDTLPAVMKKHYAVRSFSQDSVKMEGHLDIHVSPFMRFAAHLTGMLVPYSGKNIPVTVFFRSMTPKAVDFDRTFHFSDKGDVKFISRMEWITKNEMVEWMRFGVGWKLAYEWDGRKVILRHQGYVWRFLGVMIPLPLAWVIGGGYAEEVPVSENSFRMWTHAKHPLLGTTFGYAGEFKITEVSVAQQP